MKDATMDTTQQNPERGAALLQIYARLQELPNYTWNPEIPPFHSVCRMASGNWEA